LSSWPWTTGLSTGSARRDAAMWGRGSAASAATPSSSRWEEETEPLEPLRARSNVVVTIRREADERGEGKPPSEGGGLAFIIAFLIVKPAPS
jgi:hypothetical protein